MKRLLVVKNCLLAGFYCVAIGLLSGCVAGQKIRLTHSLDMSNKNTESSEHIILVEVNDDRSFIKDGSKDPSYIGHFRAGFGNTWGVLTEGKVALAEKFKKDILEELMLRGFKTGTSNEGRKLLVDIRDYNFDSYNNIKHWYEIGIKVLNANDEVLAEHVLKEEHRIKGSFWVGPKKAAKRELPKIYGQIINQIVGDDVILQALK